MKRLMSSNQRIAAYIFWAILIAMSLTLVAEKAFSAGPFAAWSVPHSGTTHFAHRWAQASKTEARCGLPTGHESFDGATYTQRFQRCWMSEPKVSVHSYALVTPTSTAIPATATPTATPTAIPTAIPTPTATPPPATPASYAVSLVNQHRAQYGLPPLTENATQDSCSLAHSQHMAQEGFISHDQFPGDVCISWSYVGENVGEAGPGDTNAMIKWIDDSMWSEPHSPGCVGNHACNMIGSHYTQIGVGIYVQGGIVWLTEDFTGQMGAL